MKNTLKPLIAVVTATVIISCHNSANEKANDSKIVSYSELEKASWLIGKWENNSAEGNSTEIWERKNDSTLSGKSFVLKGTDTVSAEAISLEQNGSELFYVPIVKGQNNGQPVKFKLTSSVNNQLVFENPEHDFPQKISYALITEDSLLAEISGTMQGKQNSMQYPMTRVK